ncbi:ependymin-like [Sardina pilchardus]|uniref:ependymin-like n=1 Tax=Sardina pilchardus TaxID=27697 RepID=UPI002E1127C5
MKTLPVVLASLCLAFGTTLAAPKPTPCASSPLLDGSFTVGGQEVFFNGRFTYDALGKQLRIRNMGMVNDKPSAKDLLMIYNEGVLYDIDHSKWSCKKYRMNSDFVPMGVPKGALHINQVVVGSSSMSGMGVLVNNWQGLTLGTNGTINYYQAVTSEFGCLPISTLVYNPSSDWTSISYYNIMLGIFNPMDFIPPSFCKQAQLESDETNFLDAMKSVAREIVSEA